MLISKTLTTNLNDFILHGASIRGPAHSKNNVVLQDCFEISTSVWGEIVISLSDGAGSCKHSDIGSSIVTEDATFYLNDPFPTTDGCEKKTLQEDDVEIAIHYAHDSLEQFAESREVDFRDLSCTLLTFVIREEDLIVANIGDGALIVRTADGEVILASEPAESRYVNTTDFITSSKWEEALTIKTIDKKIEAFMAITDGLHKAAIKPKTDGEKGWQIGDKFAPVIFDKLEERVIS